MTGTNQADRYEIQANSRIEKDASGHWLEEIAWSHAILNNKPTELSPACAAFRQRLSLAPGAALSVPDLSQVESIGRADHGLANLLCRLQDCKQPGRPDQRGRSRYF